MKFGPVGVEEAQGAILAHSMMVATGKLQKGRRLSAIDVEALRDHGVKHVIVARLDDDDLTEDEAAEQLARLLQRENLRLSPAATGRVNVYATRKGLFRADKQLVDRFNRVDPAITLACLKDYSQVSDGDMVATIKIIPLGVSKRLVDQAAEILALADAVTVHAFQAHSVALIQTQLPSVKPSVLDKTVQVLRRRLAPSGSVIVSERRVVHEENAVVRAILDAEREFDGSGPRMIILFGASAVCDAEDVLPNALRLAGGIVDHVGLPVDPGNLLVLGHKADTAIIVAPGCARSPKENGFDWVLDRILAGQPPTPDDLMGLGVGGLLMEIPSRPQPRELAGHAHKLQLGVVLLAAGQARRMAGAGHKLLAEFDSVPLVRRMADRAVEAGIGPVAVVTGYRATDVGAALEGLDVEILHNELFETGMASSIKCGLSSASRQQCDGLMVVLADMPGITSDDLKALADAFVQAEGRAIVRAVASGKRGNPVILPRATFADLELLDGDVGARHVIETCGLPIIDVELGSSAHLDVDTPEAVERAGGILRG